MVEKFFQREKQAISGERRTDRRPEPSQRAAEKQRSVRGGFVLALLGVTALALASFLAGAAFTLMCTAAAAAAALGTGLAIKNLMDAVTRS